jgi:hypothetical protein
LIEEHDRRKKTRFAVWLVAVFVAAISIGIGVGALAQSDAVMIITGVALVGIAESIVIRRFHGPS